MIKGNLTNPGGAHLSQANFRRFESYYHWLVDAYPETLTLEPADLAATTFAARIRDGANAFITHGFESSLDRNTFESVWNKCVVTTNDGKVIIGPKESVREAIRADIVHGTGIGQYLCDLTNPKEQVVNALAFLYQNQVFQIPSRLVGNPEKWVIPFGVALEPQPDGSFLLL